MSNPPVYLYVSMQGLVPFDNLADSAEKCSDVLGEMELDDVIRGVMCCPSIVYVLT